MKYYLCQTDAGPQFARNQAEAAKLDRHAVIEEVSTEKDDLMERLNVLMRTVYEYQTGKVQVLVGEGLGPIVSEEEGNARLDALIEEQETAAKTRKKETSRWERTMDQIAVEQFIHDTPEGELQRLEVLERCIVSRRQETEDAA